MALLSVSAYTVEKKDGILTLTITTSANHGLQVDYIDIQVSGASIGDYNGVFQFSVKNSTTLVYIKGIQISEYQPLTNIAGTITANTVDYTILAPTPIGTYTNLYTITSVGDYRIALVEDDITKIIYTLPAPTQCKIGERLNDTDKILYSQDRKLPNGVSRAKWLIVEVSEISLPFEIRLVKFN